MYFWPIALLILALNLSACGGKGEVVAFLDADGNNEPAPAERVLSNIALKISHNNQVLTRGRTDAKGRYAFDVQNPGYYCIEIDEPYLNQSLMRQLSVGHIPSEAVSQALMPNFSLGPSVSMAAKQIISTPSTMAPVQPTQTTPTPQPTQQNETETQEHDGAPASPAPQADEITPGKVCKNVTGISLSVAIPVTIDYSHYAENFPAPMKQEREIGDVFSQCIPLAPGCMLDTLYLPTGLKPLWPAEEEEIVKILSMDPQTGRIDFRQGAEGTSICLYLQVKTDLPCGTHSVSFKPMMLCPRGQQVEHNEYRMDLISKPSLDIVQELPAGNQDDDSQFEWKIVVKNNGRRTYDLVVTGNGSGPITSISPSSAGCSALGSNRIECSVSLEPDQTKELLMQATIMDIAVEEWGFFNASAEVEGCEEEAFEAPEKSVRIVSPPP